MKYNGVIYTGISASLLNTHSHTHSRSLPLQVAPKGLTEVNTMMCGTCSNENAIKGAFIDYMVTDILGAQCDKYTFQGLLMFVW